MSQNKIQYLLVNHLLKHGQISLKLPDNVNLEIGLTQENDNGDLAIEPNYCWIIASQEDRLASIDSYNLGISFPESEKTFLDDDVSENVKGKKIRKLNII
jgi:hypothetical protein